MTKRERNMLMVLGIVAGVALLYFVFFVLLGDGGEESGEVTAPTLPVSSPPAIAPDPGTGVGEPTDEPPRAVTFFGGRDPFVPLINPTPAPAGSPGPNGSPLPTGSPPPDDGTDPDDGDPTNGDGIAVTGRPVVLVDVLDESSVQVEVEGEAVTVTEGQRFARSYKVLSVEASCARFLYGDESFTLCEGEPPK